MCAGWSIFACKVKGLRSTKTRSSKEFQGVKPVSLSRWFSMQCTANSTYCQGKNVCLSADCQSMPLTYYPIHVKIPTASLRKNAMAASVGPVR